VGFARDITERKEAENQLRASENLFRSLFETASSGILIADVDTKRFIDANSAILNMLGYSREELLARGVDDIHPQADLSSVKKAFESLACGEISIAHDQPMLRKDGGVIHADVTASRLIINDRPCIAGIFTDITAHRRSV
jgi:PAS domain S-box-containing protein